MLRFFFCKWLENICKFLSINKPFKSSWVYPKKNYKSCKIIVIEQLEILLQSSIIPNIQSKINYYRISLILYAIRIVNFFVLSTNYERTLSPLVLFNNVHLQMTDVININNQVFSCVKYWLPQYNSILRSNFIDWNWNSALCITKIFIFGRRVDKIEILYDYL